MKRQVFFKERQVSVPLNIVLVSVLRRSVFLIVGRWQIAGSPHKPIARCALITALEAAQAAQAAAAAAPVATLASPFDEPRAPGALSAETKIVSFNPCKGDPYGATSMPIYQTATFAQPSADQFGSHDYTRSGNPTRDAAQKVLAEIDGAASAFCYSTGMAALAAATRFAAAGQEIVLSDDSYGGTYRLLAQVASRQGISTVYCDMSGAEGPANLRRAMTSKVATLAGLFFPCLVLSSCFPLFLSFCQSFLYLFFFILVSKRALQT